MGKTGSVKDTRLLRPICGKSGPEGFEDIRDGGHAFFLALALLLFSCMPSCSRVLLILVTKEESKRGREPVRGTSLDIISGLNDRDYVAQGP